MTRALRLLFLFLVIFLGVTDLGCDSLLDPGERDISPEEWGTGDGGESGVTTQGKTKNVLLWYRGFTQSAITLSSSDNPLQTMCASGFSGLPGCSYVCDAAGSDGIFRVINIACPGTPSSLWLWPGSCQGVTYGMQAESSIQLGLSYLAAELVVTWSELYGVVYDNITTQAVQSLFKGTLIFRGTSLTIDAAASALWVKNESQVVPAAVLALFFPSSCS